MKRLIFINRYFHPDQSATSQMLSDLAFHLAARGRDVHIVTSRQMYENAGARLPAEQTINGVHVHRVFSTRFGRAGMLGRATDYLSFYMAVSRFLRAFIVRDDIIIAKTDPPMIALPAMRAARRSQAMLVNWLQDLYPEIAMQLGVPFIKGPTARWLAELRDKTLRAAAANVAVGQGMTARVAARGASSDRVHFISNWSDDGNITPVAHAGNPLRRDWGLENKFVVGYSGNLGRAHDFDTMLNASVRLHDDPRIIFVLIGGGHRYDNFASEVKRRGLERSYRFLPYQGREKLRFSLGAFDLHWISLKPELDGLMFPSKFYGAAAAGRPILSLSTKDGDIAHLMRDYDCGFAIEPGNAPAVAELIAALAGDPERCEAIGVRARAMLDERFNQRLAFAQWRALLDRLDKESCPRSEAHPLSAYELIK